MSPDETVPADRGPNERQPDDSLDRGSDAVVRQATGGNSGGASDDVSGAGTDSPLAPEPPFTIESLLSIMAALRDPDTGCPWDQQQTFETIVPYTIEEAYEVGDAVARGDLADLKDELGDLLLQVVYHSQMASETGSFSFEDVTAAICEKMIRRHPHVFGSTEQRAAGAAPGFWQRIKNEERAKKQAERARLGIARPATESLLDGVPGNLPALSQAIKLQNAAAGVGFDWPSLAPVMAKMREELAELDEAIAREDQAAVMDEFGDLLFVMANTARHLKVDPEAALSQTNAKFRRRFARIERLLSASGRDLETATLDEMDALWDQAKREERS